MGCSSCGSGGGCGTTGGCKNSGLCASGSCNKMNSYDWISTLDYDDPSAYEYVEVSFKNGARKDFFKNPQHLITGDTVLTEVSGGGYDIGVIALSGDLVRLQMKKKFTNEDKIGLNIIRRANDRDLEKLENKVEIERQSMVLARAIAVSLNLEIKIGDVEYQGDMKKATFFFTANGRVDFRELVRAYAKEFKVKIEMRQIGSRQESARIGGVGTCGRELCCSTWLSDFRSVNTTVARYQNIAINQTKLSGQCGRLKCCLNYELDAYVDALQHFPTHANYVMTKKGRANLVKTDIFKGLMFYVYEDISMRGVFHPLDKEKVKEILALNKKGVFPEDLSTYTEVKEVEQEPQYEDVTGQIELPNTKKKKKKGKPTSDNQRRPDNNNPNPQNREGQQENRQKQQPRNQQPQAKSDGNNPASDNVKQNENKNPQNREQNKNQQRNNGPKDQRNDNAQNKNNPNQTPNNNQGGERQNNNQQNRNNQQKPSNATPVEGQVNDNTSENQQKSNHQNKGNQNRPQNQRPNDNQRNDKQNNVDKSQNKPAEGQSNDNPNQQKPQHNKGNQNRSQNQDTPAEGQSNDTQNNNQQRDNQQNKGNQNRPQNQRPNEGRNDGNNQNRNQQNKPQQGPKEMSSNDKPQQVIEVKKEVENKPQITPTPPIADVTPPTPSSNEDTTSNANSKGNKFKNKGGKKENQPYVPKHLRKDDEKND